MRYCAHCGVKLANDIEYCPLCDMDTQILDGNFEKDYPYVKSRFNRGLLIKLITFTALAFVIIGFTVDHLVPTGSPWMIIAALAILYLWISAMNVLRYTPNPASIILCQLICVSGLTFAIDYFTGYFRWSVNYVIPFLILSAACAVTLMIAIRPIKFRAYTIYQLVIAFLGVLAILLWVFGYSDVEWPAVTAALVSGLCFLATLMFGWRRTHNELKKRFHF